MSSFLLFVKKKKKKKEQYLRQPVKHSGFQWFNTSAEKKQPIARSSRVSPDHCLHCVTVFTSYEDMFRGIQRKKNTKGTASSQKELRYTARTTKKKKKEQ